MKGITEQFKGVFTALATPFLQNGDIDFQSLSRLVEFQVGKKITGFVLLGTTGESPTVTEAEKRKIFEHVKAIVPKGFPLILGAGGNCTSKAVEEAKLAAKVGADAILSVVPYYNKPPQRGLLEHFKIIASATDLPCILYNVPGRTITALELNTIKILSEHPNIIGIKEASGNIEFAKQIRKECGESFVLLSGDDGTYDEFMKVGGDGVISVASHIIPDAFFQRRVSQYKTLVDHLFVEANPIPLKMALFLMNLISTPSLRLPLVPLAETQVPRIKELMKDAGLLK